MTNKKQIEANKKNALLGGVKTEKGKATVRLNAMKHGLLSQEVLMEGEDEKTLLSLGKKLRNELKPATEIELLLVDRIVANYWRLKRLLKLEDGEVLDKGVFGSGGLIIKNDADLFFRYEIMLERSIYKALHELQRIQAARAGKRPPAPLAIDMDVSKDIN